MRPPIDGDRLLVALAARAMCMKRLGVELYLGGYTQQAVPEAVVLSWVREQKNPQRRTLEGIAAVLDKPVAWFQKGVVE